MSGEREDFLFYGEPEWPSYSARLLPQSDDAKAEG